MPHHQEAAQNDSVVMDVNTVDVQFSDNLEQILYVAPEGVFFTQEQYDRIEKVLLEARSEISKFLR